MNQEIRNSTWSTRLTTLIVHREPTHRTSSIRKHTEWLIINVAVLPTRLLTILCTAFSSYLVSLYVSTFFARVHSITNIKPLDFQIKCRIVGSPIDALNIFHAILTFFYFQFCRYLAVFVDSLCTFDSLLRDALTLERQKETDGPLERNVFRVSVAAFGGQK